MNKNIRKERDNIKEGKVNKRIINNKRKRLYIVKKKLERID